MDCSKQTNADQALVDSHHHFWNLNDGVYYPWLTDSPVKFFLGDYRSICHTILPDDLRAQVPEGYQLLGSVHCEAEAERTQCLEETKWITKLSQHSGLPCAHVGWAPFGQKECAAILDAQCRSPLFRGVRSKPVTAARPEQAKALRGQPRTLQDSHWLEGLALLQERDLSWDLRVPGWHLTEAAIALEAVPELRVILNHTGLPWDRSESGLQTWRDGMHRLAANPNVCVKLSELGTPWYPWRREDNLPLLCETLTIFGPERCLYASNFPVSGLQVDYGDWLALVEEAIAQTYPQAQNAVLYRNACYWYRLNV